MIVLGRQKRADRASGQSGARGFTLVELIIATTIMVILTGMALPLARVTIAREKEHELRYDLWMMRDAIDRYKDTTRWCKAWIRTGRSSSSCAGFRWIR
jgi:prepilin-type N-terminal cleavage/methylation domain-containing protein